MTVSFSSPYITSETIDEVANVLKSKWITSGRKVIELEQRINGVCVSSATAGLELVLDYYGIGKGDEVILPAYTFVATAHVVLRCGAKPVFVDVKGDFLIDIDQVENAITPNTKAIIGVDFGGVQVDYQRLMGFGIPVIADAAHSFGQPPIADFTVWSFHAVKNITTAEGGGIASKLDMEEIRRKRFFGITSDAFNREGWEYDVTYLGGKYNMTDIQAVIGLVQLKQFVEIDAKRRAVTEQYNRAFGLSVPVNSSCHLYPVLVENRDEVYLKLKEKGIHTSVHFKPIPAFTYYRSLGYDINHYPVSKWLFERELSLPLFYEITAEQVQYVIDNVRPLL
jgi:dTDP-4-amino-4,6-dideoxygalactose transaminase